MIIAHPGEENVPTVAGASGRASLRAGERRHSRGTDNDQENAGYVRESAGGSEQA